MRLALNECSPTPGAQVSKPDADIISIAKPPVSTEWPALVAAQQSNKIKTSDPDVSSTA
jgi:hypothetical protein